MRSAVASESALAILRPHHGQRLRDPLPGCEPVSPEFIQWHRDQELGGIFRWQPLPI